MPRSRCVEQLRHPEDRCRGADGRRREGRLRRRHYNGWLFWNTDATPGTAEEAAALTGRTSLNDFAVGDLS